MNIGQRYLQGELVTVIEQHVKTFECDGCKTSSEQEPSVSQIEEWVRVTERTGKATQMWDFCSWECVATAVANGAPQAEGLVIEDDSKGRRRRSEW
jgi:hypothetical protein